MALTHCEPSMVEPPSRRPSSMDNSVPSLTIETDSRDENRRPATSVLILRRAEGRRTPMVYPFLCLCWNCTMAVVRRIESAYRSKPIRMLWLVRQVFVIVGGLRLLHHGSRRRDVGHLTGEESTG